MGPSAAGKVPDAAQRPTYGPAAVSDKWGVEAVEKARNPCKWGCGTQEKLWTTRRGLEIRLRGML
jgi:hypothetical protein